MKKIIILLAALSLVVACTDESKPEHKPEPAPVASADPSRDHGIPAVIGPSSLSWSGQRRTWHPTGNEGELNSLFSTATARKIPGDNF